MSEQDINKKQRRNVGRVIRDTVSPARSGKSIASLVSAYETFHTFYHAEDRDPSYKQFIEQNAETLASNPTYRKSLEDFPFVTEDLTEYYGGDRLEEKLGSVPEQPEYVGGNNLVADLVHDYNHLMGWLRILDFRDNANVDDELKEGFMNVVIPQAVKVADQIRENSVYQDNKSNLEFVTYWLDEVKAKADDLASSYSLIDITPET